MRSAHSVDDLLDRQVLKVPDYQRGYAWEQSHLEEFWEDLEVLPPGADHYTGTIVLRTYPNQRIKDDRGVYHQRADVVDGQQRLTTVVLLLNELRRAMERCGLTDPAAAIADRYVWIKRDSALQPVLRLGGDIARFWRDVVLPDEPAILDVQLKSQDRLLRARQFFKERVEGLERAHDSVQRLTGLRDKITDRLRFTLYEVGDEAQVGVIFETLNDRGKPLTELEKTKNYLLFLASGLDEGPRQVIAERINETWSDVYRRLMEADITEPREEDQFLRAHWLMAVDHIRRHWDGTGSIKERFDRRKYWQDAEALMADVSGYVRELGDAARAFCDIRRPLADPAFGEFSEHRHEIRRWSERLKRIGVFASFTPLLMGVRLQHRGNGQLYRDVVELCEKFSFRVYRLENARANAGQGRLFRVARDVHEGDLEPDEIRERLRKAIARWCPRPSLERTLESEADVRNWYEWSGLPYFLYEYEEHLTGTTRDVKLNWTEVEQRSRSETIEHILPQTPREGDWQDFNEDDRRRLTHDLGNLVLTFDNSHYSNKDFKAKRGERGASPVAGEPPPTYARSPLRQEQEIASYRDWTPETIRSRHESLSEWALERWYVEGDEPLDPDDASPEDLEDIEAVDNR